MVKMPGNQIFFHNRKRFKITSPIIMVNYRLKDPNTNRYTSRSQNTYPCHGNLSSNHVCRDEDELDTALRISQKEFDFEERAKQFHPYMNSDEQQEYHYMNMEEKQTLCKLLSNRRDVKIQSDLFIKNQQDAEYQESLSHDAHLHERQELLGRKRQLEMEEKITKEDFKLMHMDASMNTHPEDHTHTWENTNVKIDQIRTELRAIHAKLLG